MEKALSTSLNLSNVVPLNEKESSWIDDYIGQMRFRNSPELFKRWSAIACLAGAMERRFFTWLGNRRVYPNLFVLLVADPSVGKSEASTPIADLWRGTGILKIAPSSVSAASLIDDLEDSYRMYPIPEINTNIEYHALQICADEFGVLFPEYNGGILSLLSAIFDCKSDFSERKRTLKLNKFIVNPMVNILAGTTPDFLKELLPEVAWGQGFMSRMIMIYQKDKIKFDIRGKFKPPTEELSFSKRFTDRLLEITSSHGVFYWTLEADHAFADWNNDDCPPIPKHSRLTHYNGRRLINCVKLCMISSISRGNSLKISLENFEEAKGWMLEAEALMPEIFSALGSGGDRSIIMDLHSYVQSLQEISGVANVRRSLVVQRLSSTVRAERVQKVLDIAKEMGLLSFDPFTGNVTALKLKG